MKAWAERFWNVEIRSDRRLAESVRTGQENRTLGAKIPLTFQVLDHRHPLRAADRDRCG